MSAAQPVPRPVSVERRALHWGRAVAFVAVLLWIVAPPFYRQVLGGKNKHARAWIMFSGIGLGTVDARFYERRPDGTQRELDRFAQLGSKRPSSGARRTIRGRHATWGIARQLCRTLGHDADVRVASRRATRDGWVTDYDGGTNICTQDSPPKRRNRKGRSK